MVHYAAGITVIYRNKADIQLNGTILLQIQVFRSIFYAILLKYAKSDQLDSFNEHI